MGAVNHTHVTPSQWLSPTVKILVAKVTIVGINFNPGDKADM